MKEEEFVVYQITNQVTGKIYIGATNNFKRRHIEHKCYASKEGRKSNAPIYKDMKIYGFENFKFEILHKFETKEEMFKKEEELIAWNNEHNIDNYNVAKGGMGRSTHDVSGENNPMYGKPSPYAKKVVAKNLITGEIFVFENSVQARKTLKCGHEAITKLKTLKNGIKIISYGEGQETIETKHNGDCVNKGVEYIGD